VKEAGRYPAQFNKIKQAAVTVTDLKILATRTKKPELYAKLGAEDLTEEGVGSKLFTLKNNSDNSLASLIVDKERP